MGIYNEIKDATIAIEIAKRMEWLLILMISLVSLLKLCVSNLK